MQKTIERIKLVLTLDKRGIEPKFANVYDGGFLLNRIADLEKKFVPVNYGKQQRIQEELIKNEPFADYYCQFLEAGVTPEAIEKLLGELEAEDDTVTDYDYKYVLATLEQGGLTMRYDFLKHFAHRPLNQEAFELLTSNLNLFYRHNTVNFSDISEAGRELFLEPYISRSELMPKNSIKEACDFITADENIKNIVRLLYNNSTRVALNIQHYERIKADSCQIYNDLVQILNSLENDAEAFIAFVKQWIANGCEAYDVHMIKEKAATVLKDELVTAFESRSGYINLLFGNKIRSIALQDEPEYRESLLIYAITHKKTHFIKLIEENYDAFTNIASNSVIFNKKFYSKYVNINSMNLQNLIDCANMNLTSIQWDIEILGEASYTFAEFKALYGLSEVYASLYNKLSLPKLDDKIIALKQLSKRELLPFDLTNEALESLAGKLSCKPLSHWIERDFGHIKELRYPDAIQLLIHYDSIEKFIKQLKNRIEALFILQNVDYIQHFNSLKEIKSNCMDIDKSWDALRNKLDLGDDFITEYNAHIINFLLQNGANIALTYYNNLSSMEKKEAFKRIIKAELMGKFYTLKYFEDDLNREINFMINKQQKDLWANSIKIAEGGIDVEERDDFYTTIQLGTTPQRTCLSYIDGAYKGCLLSCFDSNKKFVYASIGGKNVGRAILRLTKGRYADFADSKTATLSFVDLENLSSDTHKERSKSTEEFLTLFLEVPYIAHVSPQVNEQIMKLFVRLAEKKALALGAVLVICDYYNRSLTKGHYTRTKINLYISKSKAGEQYFDSLGGSAFVSDEGSYRSSSFYVAV